MSYSATLSENIVIGSLINNVSLLLDVSDLKSDYFVTPVNKLLFIVVKRLYQNGANRIDIADIYALIETNETHLKILENEGGVEFLEVLQEMGSGKTYDDILPHVKEIINASFRNTMSDSLTAMKSLLALSNNKPISKIYNELENELLSVKSQYTSHHKMCLIGDRLNNIFNELDREANKEFSGFPTGFPLLDRFVTYEKGELVVFSGMAKFGKSQWVVDMVYRLCIKQGIAMAIIDSELSDRFFVSRLISRITNLPFKYIKSGKYKDYAWAVEKVECAKKLIEKAPLMHEYVVDWTKDEIYSELKRMRIQHNLQIVVWDYIKVMDESSNQQERTELAMLTNFLKNKIAGELNVSAVALAQTSDYSREGGLRIFGSNQIKQYCSTVIYMCRKNKEQLADDLAEAGGNCYFVIKENRNGKQFPFEDKGINFNFNSSRAIFELAEYQHQEIEDMSTEDDIAEDKININEEDELD